MEHETFQQFFLEFIERLIRFVDTEVAMYLANVPEPVLENVWSFETKNKDVDTSSASAMMIDIFLFCSLRLDSTEMTSAN